MQQAPARSWLGARSCSKLRLGAGSELGAAASSGARNLLGARSCSKLRSLPSSRELRACVRSLRCKLHGTKRRKKAMPSPSFFFFFSCNTKKKQHKDKCLPGSGVGLATIAPSSKLVPNSKLAPAPSRLQAPSLFPLNVCGARSSGDG
ncbi:unnamed protein product, partial [Sphagnum balticum]